MQFDPQKLASKQVYKLLTGSVVPRPIAFISSRSGNGVLNAAPFSFFNVFSASPPMICVSVGSRAAGAAKDTGRNIVDTGDFVVNIVDEALAEKMNQASASFPAEVDEFQQVGLTPVPSVKVHAPRILESPVNLECSLYHHLPLKSDSNILYIAEVLWMHLRDDICLPDYKVDATQLRAVGRLAGSEYTYTRDLFHMERPK